MDEDSDHPTVIVAQNLSDWEKQWILEEEEYPCEIWPELLEQTVRDLVTAVQQMYHTENPSVAIDNIVKQFAPEIVLPRQKQFLLARLCSLGQNYQWSGLDPETWQTLLPLMWGTAYKMRSVDLQDRSVNRCIRSLRAIYDGYRTFWSMSQVTQLLPSVRSWILKELGEELLESCSTQKSKDSARAGISTSITRATTSTATAGVGGSRKASTTSHPLTKKQCTSREKPVELADDSDSDLNLDLDDALFTAVKQKKTT